MRRFFASLILAWVFSASAAFADRLTSVTFAPSAQEKFAQEYGEREIAGLTTAIERAIGRAVAQGGAPPGLRVEVTVLDAVPSRPTLQQASDRPGLDVARSVGLGGATLSARIMGPDGSVRGEVTHRYYETDLAFSNGASTWSDAHRAISGFARKVGQKARG